MQSTAVVIIYILSALRISSVVLWTHQSLAWAQAATSIAAHCTVAEGLNRRPAARRRLGEHRHHTHHHTLNCVVSEGSILGVIPTFARGTEPPGLIGFGSRSDWTPERHQQSGQNAAWYIAVRGSVSVNV
jgi:hypothetical protein